MFISCRIIIIRMCIVFVILDLSIDVEVEKPSNVELGNEDKGMYVHTYIILSY